MKDQLNYIAAADFVKGIAIIWVVVFHMFKDFPEFFCASSKMHGLTLCHLILCGGLAVNLFVLISGYLLVRNYKDRGNPLRWWKSFYRKRLLRILPIYYAGIAFVLLADYLVGHENFDLEIFSLIAHLLGIHTFTRFIFDIEGAWWFIGLICQLYLIFPILFYFLKKFPYKVVFPVVVLSTIGARLIPIGNLNGNYSIFAFLPDFVMGMLLADRLAPELNVKKSWFINALMMVSILAGLCSLHYDIPIFSIGYGTLRPFISFGIFSLILKSHAFLIRYFKPITGLICLFGRNSYAIYIFHRPLIYKFVSSTVMLFPPSFIAVLFLAWVLFAGILVHHIENLVFNIFQEISHDVSNKTLRI